MGKVIYLGASNIEAWRLARGLWISDEQGWRRFDWVRIGYPTSRSRSGTGNVPTIAGRVGITAFSPLAGGWLTGESRGPGEYPEGSRMTLRPEPYAHPRTQWHLFEALPASAEQARLGQGGLRHAGAGLDTPSSAGKRRDHRSAEPGAPRRGGGGEVKLSFDDWTRLAALFDSSAAR